MPNGHFSKLANKTLENLPLRAVLVIPFVLQIMATVGLVGYLSWKNGEKAVNNLASQLQEEIGKRAQEVLGAEAEVVTGIFAVAYRFHGEVTDNCAARRVSDRRAQARGGARPR